MFKSNVGWIFCQIWSHCRLEYNKSDQMLEFKVAQLFHKVAQFVATNVVFKDCNIAKKLANIWTTFERKFVPKAIQNPRLFKNHPIWSLWTQDNRIFSFLAADILETHASRQFLLASSAMDGRIIVWSQGPII